MKKIVGIIVLGALLVSLPFLIKNDDKELVEKVGGEHPGYFKQWFEMKKNKDGVIPNFRQSKWMDHDAQMQRVWSRRAGGNPITEVKELGPTYVGGRTRAIWVNPDNENIMLAGGASGGMWRSTDAGLNWNPLNDHQASLLVTTISMNPFNHKELYYGTGEYRGENLGITGEGIFKSTDGGLTFNQLKKSRIAAFGTVSVLRHSKVSDSTIYVGTQSTDAPIYYSTNSGDTFKAFTASFGRIGDMEVFPDDKILCGVTYSGIYKISPGLQGYTKITSPVFPTSFARVEIEYCDKFPNVVYAMFEGRTYFDKIIGVFKSLDGGETWAEAGVPDIGTAQGTYCMDLAVHPTNSNKVMASGVNIGWTSNGGTTWIKGKNGHSDYHTHAYLKGSNYAYILLGNDGGVYKHSWTSTGVRTDLNNGYKVTQFYAGDCGASGDTWIAGTQDNGTHRLLNGGQRKVNGADGGYAFISQQNPDLAYLSQQNATLKRITNFTSSSTVASKNLIPTAISTEGVNFINQFYMNRADGQQLYYRTAKGIWRSTNSGTNWSKISTATNIGAITSTQEVDPILYYGRSRATFFRKEKAATSGSTGEVQLSNNMPREAKFGNISGIEIHPRNENTVFLAFGQNGIYPKIWKVENCDNPDSLKWTDLAGDLSTSLPVNDIALHPQAPDTIMFAATDFGLYYTNNGGKSWVKDNRIPSVAIFKIEMRASDRHAFLFTHGRGVWRISTRFVDLPTSMNTVKKIDFDVYPNPVNDGMIYVDYVSGKADLSILDLNGKVVLKSKIQGIKNQINVQDLKSGIYIVQVLDGGNKSSKKLIITK